MDGNSSVIGYHVFRGVVAGNLTQVATVSGLGYTDTGLVAGTTYYYEVTAFNAAGDGHASSETSITAPVLSDPPVGLTATVSGGKITLEWNQPAGTNVFTYSIFRGNGSGVEVFLTNYPATSWVDSNVTDGQTYYYRVSATTMHGESQMSEEAVATTEGAQNQIQAGMTDQLWFRMVIIMTILVVGFFSFVVFVRNGTLRVNLGK
jgi:cellulose 1,4-beta-cellobiosidase